MKMQRNIEAQTQESEKLPKLLESIKQEENSLKVPDRYFEMLNLRITDKLNANAKRSVVNVSTFRKPVFWAPVFATALVAMLLIFTIPSKKTSTIPVADEWAELNMAYDPSYAEEVMLAESYSIDREIEKSDVNLITASINSEKSPSDDEIAEYLKEQEIDIDLITDK